MILPVLSLPMAKSWQNEMFGNDGMSVPQRARSLHQERPDDFLPDRVSRIVHV